MRAGWMGAPKLDSVLQQKKAPALPQAPWIFDGVDYS